MADQSDIEKSIVALLAATLYPNGLVGNPPPSALGCPARVGRGWPDAKALDDDLRAGVLNVTVYPRPNTEKNTTRFTPQWQPLGAVNPPTFTLSQAGQVVTVGGSGPSTYYPQNLCVLIGAEAYLYQTVIGDTPASIATALGAIIDAALGDTTVTGAAITLPPTAMVEALRIGSTGTIAREVSRQERQFQIVVWCFNPDLRDQACSLIKPALDGVEFLTLPDGSQARMYYASSTETDAPEKEILYRRDLIYCVEWPTLQTHLATQIVTNQVALNEGQPLGAGPNTATFDF